MCLGLSLLLKILTTLLKEETHNINQKEMQATIKNKKVASRISGARK